MIQKTPGVRQNQDLLKIHIHSSLSLSVTQKKDSEEMNKERDLLNQTHFHNRVLDSINPCNNFNSSALKERKKERKEREREREREREHEHLNI